MSYFIHNKYDKTSVAQLSSMKAAGHTIIDYYGLLEQNDETYKNLNVDSMPCVVSTLEYVNSENRGSAISIQTDDSKFNFSTSIIVKSIQRGIGGVTNVTFKTINNVTIYTGIINISPVDPTKSFVVLSDGSYGRYSAGYSPAVAQITSNTIVLKGFDLSTTEYLGWQVIEFR